MEYPYQRVHILVSAILVCKLCSLLTNQPSFAPLTIITGIYGMNVSQLSGSNENPSIWQPFVAVAIMNVVLLVILACSNWVHIRRKHGRAAGFKEVVGFAVGNDSSGSMVT